MNLWVWSRSVDFWLLFSLQGFSILYIILSEFLTKDVLECIVNSTYLIECCDCTLINLALKIIATLFNNTQDGMLQTLVVIGVIWFICEIKISWLSIPQIPVHGRNYIAYFFFQRYCFWYLHYASFCVPIKHDFLKVFPF